MSASSEFAARVVKLNNIAREVLNAKARGDKAKEEMLMRDFRALLGKSDLPAIVREAKKADMPSDFLTKLEGFGNTVTTLVKWVAVLVVVGIAVYVWRKYE